MNQRTIEVTYGCLLHDIGKVVYRGTPGKNHSILGWEFLRGIEAFQNEHSILNCVRYHHATELKDAPLPQDDLAFITYVADNIAAAADRRSEGEQRGFERSQPLASIFTHLNDNGERDRFFVDPVFQDGKFRMPVHRRALSEGEYAGILDKLKRELEALPPSEEWLNSLLSVLEGGTSTIPSSTSTAESPDISLFDHVKVSAAVGACICEYLRDKGEEDFKKALFTNESRFKEEQCFLLYSADFSGIQKFIYTVSSTNALRSLRSRSFFLELALEHYIDVLLDICGVCRTNLLYSGGGHCYILLPNTKNVQHLISTWNDRFNEWLLKQFGTRLYLAEGMTPCCANDLTDMPYADCKAPYAAMFQRVSFEVAQRKVQRYSAEQLLKLNQAGTDESGRECRICGRVDHLTDSEGGKSVCSWCSVIENLSGKIQRQQVIVVEQGEVDDADFILPLMAGVASFRFTDIDEARSLLKCGEDVLRVYTMNTFCAGLSYSTRLYVGVYAHSNSMADLAAASDGIRRLGVCRMDVDDLGHAFVAGFVQKDGNRKYVTISRTAAFSRQLSLFFKCYINEILDREYKNDKLSVAIVYSGGDDVFLVGAWDHVVEAASRIRQDFKVFCCGALTISAGVGFFDDHFPIRLAAQFCAELEDEAKHSGKDAIALFQAGSDHCYKWNVYLGSVQEKLKVLVEFFATQDNQRGMAFLYRILELLRDAKQNANKIALARYAYLLARLEPSGPGKATYRKFADKMFEWALSAKDRVELITTIYLYVYHNRGKE